MSNDLISKLENTKEPVTRFYILFGKTNFYLENTIVPCKCVKDQKKFKLTVDYIGTCKELKDAIPGYNEYRKTEKSEIVRSVVDTLTGLKRLRKSKTVDSFVKLFPKGLDFSTDLYFKVDMNFPDIVKSRHRLENFSGIAKQDANDPQTTLFSLTIFGSSSPMEWKTSRNIFASFYSCARNMDICVETDSGERKEFRSRDWNIENIGSVVKCNEKVHKWKYSIVLLKENLWLTVDDKRSFLLVPNVQADYFYVTVKCRKLEFTKSPLTHVPQTVPISKVSLEFKAFELSDIIDKIMKLDSKVKWVPSHSIIAPLVTDNPSLCHNDICKVVVDSFSTDSEGYLTLWPVPFDGPNDGPDIGNKIRTNVQLSVKDSFQIFDLPVFMYAKVVIEY